MLLTFDCYGTLIDWETGIRQALHHAYPESAAFSDEMLGRQFHAVQNRLKTEGYRTYRTLLTEVATELAARHEWEDATGAAQSVAESVPTWRPFDDTNRSLVRLRDAGLRLAILSNIDNDLLHGTLTHIEVTFDRLGTAEDLMSYKPALPHFELGARWAAEESDEDGSGATWIHVAQSLFHDIVPATAIGLPAVWVNRRREHLPPAAEPVYQAPNLGTAVDWILSSR